MQPCAYEPLDLFACWGDCWTSRAISLGTSSVRRPWDLSWAPSHIAFAVPFHGNIVWLESTTLIDRACVISGRRINGVQAHLPEDRIGDYGGRVEVYRLIPKLEDYEQATLWKAAKEFLGKGYDFNHVLVAGTKVVRWSRILPGAWGADLDNLFCSELAAHILMRLNRLNWDNPTRYSPARLLRTVVRNGTYRRISR